jgi:hypothetical protein
MNKDNVSHHQSWTAFIAEHQSESLEQLTFIGHALEGSLYVLSMIWMAILLLSLPACLGAYFGKVDFNHSPMAHGVCLDLNYDPLFRMLGDRVPSWVQAAQPPGTTSLFLLFGLIAFLRLTAVPLTTGWLASRKSGVTTNGQQLCRRAAIGAFFFAGGYATYCAVTDVWTLLTMTLLAVESLVVVCLGVPFRNAVPWRDLG